MAKQAELSETEGTPAQPSKDVKRQADRYFYDKMKSCGISRGSIKDVVRDTDEDFENWLANRVIEMQCESISEYIRETLLEKYYNEVHDNG